MFLRKVKYIFCSLTVVFGFLSGCSRSPNMSFDEQFWIGKNIREFESQYGSKGEDIGSGLHVYIYTIDGDDYTLSVNPDGTIVNISALEEE